ncbi:hypothetical protein F5J12DRAFT_898676 [Pisolithus orientalis]|uniref:uncharacterized protein n=1 Tax=Pisolithus orientalis TaxID=936130 RepID=UPI0022255559|nr:uncharacterized protein F5J12DRAFT_898676 [Pisolithus orientalis]KAI5986752.1 hypothetical protein F5J12DRAFT_898676 [Pisolithus orientalis]
MAAWHPAMYCFNGTTPGQVNYNTNDATLPLYMLSQSDYWFHGINKCNEFPPADGDFLELPAGASFTVEIADNRGVTTLSDDGKHATDWPDGGTHPDNYSITNLGGAPLSSSGCIAEPNFHTQNQSMAAGSAFAISYTSSLSEVTVDNLVVFSVRYKYGVFFIFVACLLVPDARSSTPWKRVTSYDVPAAMPACPADGCICAIPDGCGQPNIYMEGFKCKVTNATSITPVGTPKPPVWCEEDQSQCVQGPKQIMIWNQAEGNNIEVSGDDLSGEPKSPAYNSKCGFQDGKYCVTGVECLVTDLLRYLFIGAQDDIFASGGSSSKRMVHKRGRASFAF